MAARLTGIRAGTESFDPAQLPMNLIRQRRNPFAGIHSGNSIFSVAPFFSPALCGAGRAVAKLSKIRWAYCRNHSVSTDQG